jgi:hypothetical protein
MVAPLGDTVGDTGAAAAPETVGTGRVVVEPPAVAATKAVVPAAAATAMTARVVRGCRMVGLQLSLCQ